MIQMSLDAPPPPGDVIYGPLDSDQIFHYEKKIKDQIFC